MDEPLVSLIVPVYNTEAYLHECVASIRAQTYSNWELVLVNDGSTDGSGRLCDALAQGDPRIHVIHRENGGASAARNTGLDVAMGLYIYFVDSDDWVAEDMLKETVAIMEQEGYDICTCAYWLAAGEKVVCSKFWKERVFQFAEQTEKQRFLCRWVLSSRLSWSACGKVFRRQIIQRNNLRFAEEQTISEDLDFFFRYLIYCQNLYYIPKALYFYRQHSASAIHVTTLQAWALDLLRMVWRHDQALSGQPLFQPFYVYGGTVLATLLDSFVIDRPPAQGLAQAAVCYRESAEWPYLLEQARLAVRDRERLRSICGYLLEGRIYGFYHYLLTKDATPYRRAHYLRKVQNVLWRLKNRVLHKRKGNP